MVAALIVGGGGTKPTGLFASKSILVRLVAKNGFKFPKIEFEIRICRFDGALGVAHQINPVGFVPPPPPDRTMVVIRHIYRCTECNLCNPINFFDAF